MPARLQAAHSCSAAVPVRAATLIAVLIAGVSCRNPQADAVIYQRLNDAADQFAIVRHEMGLLQDQLDSLRSVIAVQDTLIRRVANVVGFPIPPANLP